MMTRVLLLLSLTTLLSAAPDKEMLQLQRDVALLQEDIRGLQRSQDEKLTAIRELLAQTLEAANRAGRDAAAIDNRLVERLSQQEKSVAGPVAAVGSKVDQMSSDFSGLRESVADLTARMGKLQQQLVDLSNAVRSIQAPPPPPPGSPSASAIPAIPAESLWQNAMRDRSGGKPDLAIQQFSEYVKHYANTDLAPNAQYYIGEIHFSQGNFDDALENFDLVLEKFSDNEKTDDALFMKGQTYVKQRKLTQGAQEYRELIRRYPRSEYVPKAQAQLRAFGLSSGTASRKAAKN
jgi:tol-pal system protein YbgF